MIVGKIATASASCRLESRQGQRHRRRARRSGHCRVGGRRRPRRRAVVVIGTGSAFSAGVDLYRVIKDGPEYGRRFLPVLDRMLARRLDVPKTGRGGGQRSRHRRRLHPGGVLRSTDHGGGQRPHRHSRARRRRALSRAAAANHGARLGDGPLRDLVFTGRTVLVDEALALGLVDEKCAAEDLLDRAHRRRQAARVDSCRRVRPHERVALLAGARSHRPARRHNARVVEAWLQPHTYETIRVYLEKTVGKK